MQAPPLMAGALWVLLLLAGGLAYLLINLTEDKNS